MMGFFVEALKSLMEIFYHAFGDYGIAILLITILVRLLLLPLNIVQRKQMQKQRVLQEKTEVIKKKYEKNEKRMNEELQKMYQSESVGGAGCLVSLLQIPVMITLYQAIMSAASVGAGTMLLPWIDSLLYRDKTWILPIATLLTQILPQLYSYIPYFEALKMPKQPLSTMLPILVMNAMFVFAIPSGVGLYYFISGLFTGIEQFVYNLVDIRKLKLAKC